MLCHDCCLENYWKGFPLPFIQFLNSRLSLFWNDFKSKLESLVCFTILLRAQKPNKNINLTNIYYFIHFMFYILISWIIKFKNNIFNQPEVINLCIESFFCCHWNMHDDKGLKGYMIERNNQYFNGLLKYIRQKNKKGLVLVDFLLIPWPFRVIMARHTFLLTCELSWWEWFFLVSSMVWNLNFLGCLIPRFRGLSLPYYLAHSWGKKVICVKVNAMITIRIWTWSAYLTSVLIIIMLLANIFGQKIDMNRLRELDRNILE